MVTLIRDDLGYAWSGVDTNVVLRPFSSLRVSGGTSTGRAARDVCYTDIDRPNVKGRDGNNYGGGCRPYLPLQTNVRASASYTIPWVDVLIGAVFQYRPGQLRAANLSIADPAIAVWEPGSAHRAGTQFGARGVNLLDGGDLYGERLRMWDLRLAKNLRFAGARLGVGVDVFNLFNSDAALRYNPNYTAFRLPDGSWVEDNPATTVVERNDWGRVLNITTPRHVKLSLQLNF